MFIPKQVFIFHLSLTLFSSVVCGYYEKAFVADIVARLRQGFPYVVRPAEYEFRGCFVISRYLQKLLQFNCLKPCRTTN